MTTETDRQAIADFLKDRHIPKGLGTEEEACSIAAINLALTGELTDTIPDCMSDVIGRWIIPIQDCMPDAMRNSDEWRRLLPLAAGTGRDPELEKKRLDLILNWMWETVLPYLQPLADKGGFGAEWKRMCEERTTNAAEAARAAAEAAHRAAEAAAGAAAGAAGAAADAARAAEWDAAVAAADAAAGAAGAAAWAAAEAAAEAAADAAWQEFNPPTLLQKLVETT